MTDEPGEKEQAEQDGRIARWMRKMRESRAPQPSIHRQTNQVTGASRSMTKPIPSRVRKHNRARNKVARKSRKRNTP